MGCFLGCFGSSKDQKRKRQRYKVILRDQKPRLQKLLKADASLESPSNLFPESGEKTDAPLMLKKRKKVTFDTIVTTYEHIEVYDSTESLLENNQKGETFPKSAETHIKDDTFVLRRTNYRYGNCIESDDEFEDLDYEDYDVDDDDDDDAEYNGYVLAVLKPVENLTQWKALKSKGSSQKPLNFNVQKENLSLNMKPFEHKNWDQETTSLSNWLISSEKNMRNNKKPIC